MNSGDVLYWTAYAIPFILIIVAAAAAKLIEASPWQWKHFYRGVDLMLTSLGAGLAEILEIAKSTDSSNKSNELAVTALYVVITICVLFAVSTVHQDWQEPEKYGTGQILWLGIASNLVGLGFVIAFVQFKIKGLL
jgi:hypothetical protein